MKKLLIIVSLFSLIVACKSEKKPSVSELIDSGNLEGLRAEKDACLLYTSPSPRDS